MAQQEMIFGDYLNVLSKRKWTVLVLTALVIAATYGWSSRQEPVFSSTIRIKIQRMETFSDVFGQEFIGRGDTLGNYIYEIKGDRVLRATVEILAREGYTEDPAALLEAISASRVENTDLIDIVAQGPNADISKRRCDAVVRAFTETHDKMMTANEREEYEYIQKSLGDATNAVARLEAEMRKKMGDMKASDVTGEATKVLRSRLADTVSRLQALRNQGDYTEAYPEIVALRNTASSLESQVEQSSERESRAQDIMREYEQKRRVVEETVSFFTKRQEEARIAQMKKLERIELIQEARPGVAGAAGRAYLLATGLILGLMLGIIFAFVAENLDTSIRTLVEIEETFKHPILGIIPHFSPHDQDVPIRPNRFWDRVQHSLTGNSVAIVLFAAWSALSRRAKGGRRMPGLSSMLVVLFSPRAPASEGFRGIRARLQLAAGEGKLGSVLLTSSGPAEGKSTTVSNLAFSFAQAGKKTLVVCGNMRRPTLHKTFGVEREGGLSDILVGTATWRETLRDHRDFALGSRAGDGLATALGAENLFLIPCGGKTIQPSEWLSLPRLAALVKEWEAEFDVVLMDGPPVLPVPDSVIMASAVKRVVLIYQAGGTHRDSMLRTLSLIENTGATIAGFVLNDLKGSWSESPEYFSYRGYYGQPPEQR